MSTPKVIDIYFLSVAGMTLIVVAGSHCSELGKCGVGHNFVYYDLDRNEIDVSPCSVALSMRPPEKFAGIVTMF